MAQNACQQMPLNDFYANLRNLISTTYNNMRNLERASEFLASMDAQTATNMGMDNTTRDVIAELRTAINETLDFYDGTSASQTKVLKTIINQLRYI